MIVKKIEFNFYTRNDQWDIDEIKIKPYLGVGADNRLYYRANVTAVFDPEKHGYVEENPFDEEFDIPEELRGQPREKEYITHDYDSIFTKSDKVVISIEQVRDARRFLVTTSIGGFTFTRMTTTRKEALHDRARILNFLDSINYFQK